LNSLKSIAPGSRIQSQPNSDFVDITTVILEDKIPVIKVINSEKEEEINLKTTSEKITDLSKTSGSQNRVFNNFIEIIKR